MPIYEYQCPDCGHVFEEWVNITSANDKAPCPECGQQAVHIISNTAFVLKGSGWYVTDYGSRKNNGHTEGQASTAASHAASADTTSSATSSTKDGSAAPASQPAPAPATATAAKESAAPAATAAPSA